MLRADLITAAAIEAHSAHGYTNWHGVADSLDASLGAVCRAANEAQTRLATACTPRAAMALLNANVPRTPGLHYADVNSATLASWALIGYETDPEDGATVMEVWLAGAALVMHLESSTLTCLEYELKAALLSEGAEAKAGRAIDHVQMERAFA